MALISLASLEQLSSEVFMNTVEYNGGLYVNPSYEALVAMGVGAAEAAGVMRAFAAAEALERRDGLLRVAALRIAPLQDAVDLGSASEEESASLLLWKQYRVDLGRIAAQDGFPESVVWPESPAA